MGRIFLTTFVVLLAFLFILPTSAIFPNFVNNYSNNNKCNTSKAIVKHSDFSGVDFSFSLGEFSIEYVKVDKEIFQRLSVKGGGHTVDYAKAELPTISYYLAVPQGAEVNLNYDVLNYVIQQNFNVYPSQYKELVSSDYKDSCFQKNNSFYSLDEYYPNNIVEISPIMVIRGCRVVMITIFPFTFNPATGTLKIYKDIDINVNFIGVTGEFIPERLRSIYFQPIYDVFLLNAEILERASVNNPSEDIKRLDENTNIDLLIVVYDDFYNAILPLATWRHATGIKTMVVNFSDITNSTDIIEQSEDFRLYMMNAYYNWDCPPSFLLIVGDADHIPVNYLHVHPHDHEIMVASDLWYASFDESYFPDIHTGRISVENSTELSIVIDKILNYSKTPYIEEDWFNNVLIASHYEENQYFIYTSDRVYNFLDSIGYQCNRQYERDNNDPWQQTNNIIDAINNGVIIANHVDHGVSQNYYPELWTGWYHPRFTTDNITNELTNNGMYPIMFSMNCQSGWFDGETDHIDNVNYESIGEVGLRTAGKGFVAVIASTRSSMQGYNDELCVGFYDAMFPEFDPDYPDNGSTNQFDTAVFKISQILDYGKFWMNDKYIIPGGCSPYPQEPTSHRSLAMFEMVHVHGDPTMEVWTNMPENLDVSHPDQIPLGSSFFTVHVKNSTGSVVQEAFVCLWKKGEVYMRGFTDNNGYITFNLSPSSVGDMYVTVTKHNFLPYQRDIRVFYFEEIHSRFLKKSEIRFEELNTIPDSAETGETVIIECIVKAPRWMEYNDDEWAAQFQLDTDSILANVHVLPQIIPSHPIIGVMTIDDITINNKYVYFKCFYSASYNHPVVHNYYVDVSVCYGPLEFTVRSINKTFSIFQGDPTG